MCLPSSDARDIFSGVVIYGLARNVKGLLNQAPIGTDAVIDPALS
jgi:hypothetical protein